MKATEATTYRSLMSHINTVSERLNNLRLQSATGKKLSAPSDQPAAIRPVLLDRSQLTASDRYIEANYKALERVNTMDSHFSQMEDLMTRVKEITIAANNGSVNQADRASYAMNVAQIREELFTTANSQINGQYLFAGFSDDVTPFTANSASVSGVDYRGDSRSINLEIGPDNRVTVNHDGNSLFLGLDDVNGDGNLQPNGVDLFEMLANLERALRGLSGQVLDATGTPLPDSAYLNGDPATETPILLDGVGNPVLDSMGEQIPLLYNGEPIRLSPQLDLNGNPVLDLTTGKPIYLHTDGTLADVDAGGDPIFYDAQGDPQSLLDASSNPVQLTKVPTLDSLLATIDIAAEQVRYHRTESGHLGKRLEESIAHLEDVQVDITESLSHYQDADLLEVFSEMTRQESALEAALNITGRISRLSILDYL